MANGPKLTAAQRRLLEYATRHSGHVMTGMLKAEADALVASGLLRITGKPSRFAFEVYAITPAGRAALEASR